MDVTIIIIAEKCANNRQHFFIFSLDIKYIKYILEDIHEIYYEKEWFSYELY
jgi:hypothetical protein